MSGPRRAGLAELGRPSRPLTVFPGLDGRLAHLPGRAHPVHRLGPGGLDFAHSPEESVLLADVYEAVRLYALAAWHFTKPA